AARRPCDADTDFADLLERGWAHETQPAKLGRAILRLGRRRQTGGGGEEVAPDLADRWKPEQLRLEELFLRKQHSSGHGPRLLVEGYIRIPQSQQDRQRYCQYRHRQHHFEQSEAGVRRSTFEVRWF